MPIIAYYYFLASKLQKFQISNMISCHGTGGTTLLVLRISYICTGLAGNIVVWKLNHSYITHSYSSRRKVQAPVNGAAQLEYKVLDRKLD
jgi:hypothetical protein